MINEFRPMNHLTSLQNFICTIGNLPTSYALSLSYEEQIWWLCDFLEKKVFPAIEENTNITEETQQAFIELQNYVRDYFNNLDVQEEINNKLDEMAESGVLEQLIGDYVMKKLDYYLIDNTMTQEQIQELFNIERAKIIEFKNGTYNFADTFRINQNTKIILNDANLVFSTKHGFFNFKYNDEFTAYNGNGNIEIIGGKMNANISLCHGNNIKIKNVYFYHVLNDHIIELAANKNVLIEECIFEGVAVQENDRNYVEYIQTDFMSHDAFPWLNENSPTYDYYKNENITIKKNRFLKPNIATFEFYTAMGNHGHDSEHDYVHKNIYIEDNYFEGWKTYCLNMYDVENLFIINNQFVNEDDYNISPVIRLVWTMKNVNILYNDVNFNGQFISNVTHVDNLKINFNRIYNFIQSQYIQSTSSIIDSVDCNYIEFCNNTIFDCDKPLFYSHNSDDISGKTFIENNNIIYTLQLKGHLIRCYTIGEVYVNNNNFNINNSGNSYLVRLHQNVTKLLLKGNNYELSQTLVDLNGYTGSKKQIFDVYFVGFDGTGNPPHVLDSQPLNYNYNEFNTLIAYLGGNNTNEIRLNSYYMNYLANRRFAFPIVNTDGNSSIATVELNEDGTLSISEPNNKLYVSRIYLVNL